MIILLLLLLLLPIKAEAAVCNSECPSCCGLILPSGQVPPAFAAACYVGSGNDNRRLYDAMPVAQAGMIKICEFTAQAGNNNSCIFRVPAMGDDKSCFFDNVGTGQCISNAIQRVGEGYLELGTDASVNAAGRPYCYWVWGAAPNYHGTGTYTGDGTTPRTISLTSTPDFVVVKNGTIGSDVLGNAVLRMVPFTAGQSSPVEANYVTAAFTDEILNFVSNPNGFTVGSSMNTNATTYYYAWWKKNGMNFDVLSSTGTGSAQTITPGCSPVEDVWTADTQSALSTCRWWRSSAVGFGVSGPGHLVSSNDLYAFQSTQPNNSGPGILGGLTFPTLPSSTYVAQDVCSTNTRVTYHAITCAPPPHNGSVQAGNWVFDPRFIAVWPMTEATNATRTNTASLGPCGSSCDLSVANTVAKDTTIKLFDGGSAAFSGTSTVLSCLFGNCGSNLNKHTTMSWFTFYNPTNTGVTPTLMRFAGTFVSGNLSWQILQNTSNLRCRVIDAGGGDHTVDLGTMHANVWSFLGCVFDDTANTLTPYLDGTTLAPVTVNDMHNVSTGQLDFGDSVNGVTANMQYAGVFNGVLSATDMCRICSCGVDGTLCSCFAGDHTQYIDKGRNENSCAACTLPSCDKVTPS